jgi:hypothetical protein
MCLVWCHGNPIGKWDRSDFVVPTRPAVPSSGAIRARVVLRFGRRPAPHGSMESVAARRSFLV